MVPFRLQFKLIFFSRLTFRGPTSRLQAYLRQQQNQYWSGKEIKVQMQQFMTLHTIRLLYAIRSSLIVASASAKLMYFSIGLCCFKFTILNFWKRARNTSTFLGSDISPFRDYVASSHTLSETSNGWGPSLSRFTTVTSLVGPSPSPQTLPSLDAS